MAHDGTTMQDAAALASAHAVEELGDQLSACADSIHARVLDAIRQHGDADVPAATQATARALLEAESELRQRANRLYADAATCIVAGLDQPQRRLTALTQDAAARIRRIVHLGDGITLVARLLGLAAAVASGQAAPVLAAIDAVKTQLRTIAVDDAAGAAADGAAADGAAASAAPPPALAPPPAPSTGS